MNFAKVDRTGVGGWGAINREGAFVQITTVYCIYLCEKRVRDFLLSVNKHQ